MREQYPFMICSIAEFEGLLAACGDHSMAKVLSDKLGTAHRQWLMRGFLGERYPGSLMAASTMFEDGMDPVIQAKSRLTGRQ